MKVLIVSTMVPSALASSAGAIVMFDELRAIAHAHDVTLVTLAVDEDRAALGALRAMGLQVYETVRHRDDGITGFVRRAAVGMRWRLGDAPLRTTLFREPGVQRMLDGLRGMDFDVVHVLDNAMAGYELPTARATLLSEYEVRIDAEDSWVNGVDVVSSEVREAERARWWRYQSESWSRFDRVQVFTEADADSIRRIAPRVADRVRVNPFGVAVPSPTTDVRERPDTIAFVGGFRHPPNVDAALWLIDEILPRIRSRRPAVQLTIVGADPPTMLRSHADASITITGRVDRVEPFVASAAVIVAPVRSGGGMRLKVLQAMALGRPVVTTSRGAAGVWNPPDAPTLRVADDAAGIADHVVTLLESAAERSSLGTRAREAIRIHHQPATFAERLRAIYAELIPTGVTV